MKACWCLTGAGLALVAALAGSLLTSAAVAQRPKETPPDILAVQIRSQGYPCEKPRKAEMDAKLTKPDLAVWILECENMSYRIHLVPGLAAKVERLNNSRNN